MQLYPIDFMAVNFEYIIQENFENKKGKFHARKMHYWIQQFLIHYISTSNIFFDFVKIILDVSFAQTQIGFII